MHKFLGDFGFTVVLAIFWTLAFEIPVLNLEKLIWNKNKRNHDSKMEATLNLEMEPIALQSAQSNTISE